MQLSLQHSLFELSNFTVESVPNVAEAFKRVKCLYRDIAEGSIEPMFNLVVLDLNMPVLDGYDTCVSIRSLFDQQLVDPDISAGKIGLKAQLMLREIPLIVANTADSVGQVNRACEKAGFDKVFCQLSAVDIASFLLPELNNREIGFQAKIDRLQE